MAWDERTRLTTEVSSGSQLPCFWLKLLSEYWGVVTSKAVSLRERMR